MSGWSGVGTKPQLPRTVRGTFVGDLSVKRLRRKQIASESGWTVMAEGLADEQSLLKLLAVEQQFLQ